MRITVTRNQEIIATCEGVASFEMTGFLTIRFKDGNRASILLDRTHLPIYIGVHHEHASQTHTRYANAANYSTA